MSLEQRLRDGLRRSTSEVTPDVDENLRGVHRKVKRAATLRFAAQGALAFAVILALVFGTPRLIDFLRNLRGDEPAGPVPTVSPSASPMADPLFGSWRTRALSYQDLLTGWEAGGGAVTGGRAFARGGAGESITLQFTGGRYYSQFDSRGSGPLQLGASGTYRIFGDALKMFDSHGSCEEIYRLTVGGGKLRLRFLRKRGCGNPDPSVDPPATALFANVPFMRQP